MRRVSRVLIGMLGIGLAAGCRATGRVVDAPRVDVDPLPDGNRGYLIGTPPPSAGARLPRQMIEAEVEIPGFFQPKPRFGKNPTPALTEVAPPEMDFSEETPFAQPSVAVDAQASDSYVVKKRDTLWSIAADPGVYGDATRWREIFEANRDLLKSPDRLRAGMTLRIPRGGAAAPQTASEGSVYTK